MLAEALRLRKLGFCPLWLQPKSKKPVSKDWTSAPVPSADDLRRTYRDGYNLGVRLGKPSQVGDLYVFAIDLDIRKSTKKDEALAALKKLVPSTKTMLIAQSGSRGDSRHILGLSPIPPRSRKLLKSEGFEMVFDKTKGREVKKHDWEIDLKGTGTQIAVAPSIHPDTGLEYLWLRGPETELPMSDVLIVTGETISQWTGRDETREREEAANYEYGIDRMGWSLERLREAIFKLPDDHVEDRDEWLRTGMAIHHETGGSPEGFDLWCEWSEQSAKFDEKDSRVVWRSFRGNGEAYKVKTLFRDAAMEYLLDDMAAEDDEPADTTEEFTDDAEDDSDTEGLKPDAGGKEDDDEKKERLAKLSKERKLWVKLFNKKYGIVRLGSNVVIAEVRKNEEVIFMNEAHFRLLHKNKWLQNARPAQLVCDMWLAHPERRDFKGVEFAPGTKLDPLTINLWRGWGVEPSETASCKLYLRHLRDIICQGDQESFDYLLDWMAHMVQFPLDKPGVAIVINGKKGAGKDTLAEYLAVALGQSAKKVSGSDQVTGRFNATLESALLIHAEEAFFAGDPREADKLKHLITSLKLRVERKGIDTYETKSFARFILTSNHARPVDATGDERRYFALTASDDRLGDFEYFDALYNEMKGEGPAGLLDLLLTRDLTDFQVRRVPKTKALARIKLESLPNEKRWWYEILQEGELPGDFDDLDDVWSRKEVQVDTTTLRESLDRFLDRQRYGTRSITKDRFGKLLREAHPNIERLRSRRGSEFVWTYRIPALSDCRSQFEAAFGLKIEWDNVGDSDEPTTVKHGSDLL